MALLNLKAMKKLIIVILLSLAQSVFYTQNFHYPNSTISTYGEVMTDEVLASLSSEEQQMYFNCLDTIGVVHNEIKWVTEETTVDLASDKDYYYTITSKRSTNLIRDKQIHRFEGKNSLETPECIVFFNRQNGYFTILVQKHY